MGSSHSETNSPTPTPPLRSSRRARRLKRAQQQFRGPKPRPFMPKEQLDCEENDINDDNVIHLQDQRLEINEASLIPGCSGIENVRHLQNQIFQAKLKLLMFKGGSDDLKSLQSRFLIANPTPIINKDGDNYDRRLRQHLADIEARIELRTRSPGAELTTNESAFFNSPQNFKRDLSTNAEPSFPSRAAQHGFVTLHEGGSSSDSSPSDSFDDTTPLSTPPTATPLSVTHDTSRAGFHKQDLESFAKDLQNAADRAFPNDGRHQPRYRDVSVLLLRREDDEMNVDWELDDLDKVFMNYGFNTERWLIPSKNPHLKLMSKAINLVEEHDEKDDLVIVYYAGHAYINAARQATWCCKRDPNYASLKWSAIQSLFEKAQLDVLLLLDCCAAASAAPSVGSAVTETIAACGFETIAPQPGRCSFTNTLIEVLEDWIDSPPFSAAMLHNKVLSVLKHERPERVQSGKRRKMECRRTPIHIVATADLKLPSIELGRRRPILNLSMGPESGSAFLNAVEPTNKVSESSVAKGPSSAAPTKSHKRKEYELDSLQDVEDGQYKVPRVLISLALEENQTLNSESAQKWLASCPNLVKFAKIEAVFKSFSMLVLLSVPICIWNLLPGDPACAFVGYVTSPNMLYFGEKTLPEPDSVKEEINASNNQGQGQQETSNASKQESFEKPRFQSSIHDHYQSNAQLHDKSPPQKLVDRADPVLEIPWTPPIFTGLPVKGPMGDFNLDSAFQSDPNRSAKVGHTNVAHQMDWSTFEASDYKGVDHVAFKTLETIVAEENPIIRRASAERKEPQVKFLEKLVEDFPSYLKFFGMKGENWYDDGAKFEHKPQKKCLDDIIKIKTEPGICISSSTQKTRAGTASSVSIWSSKMGWKMESENPKVKEMNVQRSHGPETEDELTLPRLTEVEDGESDLKLHICGISSCKSNQELYHDASPQADCLYHCPWEKYPDSGCQHKPEKLECNYYKYVDFHLKLYKCKVSHCQQQGLRFKSAGRLLRHNREAHDVHGHGDKPFICPYAGCERRAHGNGFLCNFNHRDHIKRAHNVSDQSESNDLGSPQESGPAGGKKRKDYPAAWGCLASEGSIYKRILTASDGSRPDWEKAEAQQKKVYMEGGATADEGHKYVTDLDLFHTATEKGPWVADDLSTPDLDYLMDTISVSSLASANFFGLQPSLATYGSLNTNIDSQIQGTKTQGQDEAWTNIEDLSERRKMQNRIAQRNFRERLKRRLEDLENQAGSSSDTPDLRTLLDPANINVHRLETSTGSHTMSIVDPVVACGGWNEDIHSPEDSKYAAYKEALSQW